MSLGLGISEPAQYLHVNCSALHAPITAGIVLLCEFVQSESNDEIERALRRLRTRLEAAGLPMPKVVYTDKYVHVREWLGLLPSHPYEPLIYPPFQLLQRPGRVSKGVS